MLIYIFVCFVTLSCAAALKKAPKLTDLPDSGAGPNEVLDWNSPCSTINVLFTMARTTL